LHYFDCPVCLGQLQALQAVREQLRLHPAPVSKRPKILSWPVLSWGLIGVAAALLVAAFNSQILGYIEGKHAQNAGITIKSAPPAKPAEPGNTGIQLAQLADLRPPSYHAPTLRGESETGPFAIGIQRYSAGDCSGAVAMLAKVPPADDHALAARFYTGVCRMSSGDLASAAATLRRVAAAGDSPVQESALYYLAQIALARNDLATAQTTLNQVIALHGDFEDKAKAQLNKLPK
jgi:TolA-binding protein